MGQHWPLQRLHMPIAPAVLLAWGAHGRTCRSFDALELCLCLLDLLHVAAVSE